MKKTYWKIIMIILFVAVLMLLNKSTSNAATAGISANNKDVKVGDSVNVNVSVNAITWNLKVNGSGISDTIVGGNMDELANKTTNKSYKLNTSTPGTYTINLSGDVTDASDGKTSTISDSVTIKVSEKSTSNGSGENSNTGNSGSNDEKTKEPTFSTVNQAVYATQEGINVRSSYSTSSSSIGKLKKGEEVTRIGVGSNGWSKVKYNGTTAYISSSLLTTTKPKEEKSTIKALKSLVVSPGTISPEFDPETTKYTMTVGTDVTKLNIEALLEDEKSKLDISGNEDLQLGENIIKIVVTAEDETARTYTITVTKEDEVQLKLSTLTIKGVELTPNFDPDVYEYKAEVDSSVTKLDVEALCDDADASVEILGNEGLVDGENTITIMIKSKDEKQNVTYQIIVNKTNKAPVTTNTTSKTNDDNMQYIIVGSVLGGILLIIIIVLIAKKIRKNREDDGVELNFMDDIKAVDSKKDKEQNNYYEKQNINTEENVENNEDNQILEKKNKLYNVENDVDFKEDIQNEYEDVKPSKKKKKGKHF